MTDKFYMIMILQVLHIIQPLSKEAIGQPCITPHATSNKPFDISSGSNGLCQTFIVYMSRVPASKALNKCRSFQSNIPCATPKVLAFFNDVSPVNHNK